MYFDGPRTQILTGGQADNSTVAAYTVPVGKKFYLISAMVRTDGGAAGEVRGLIRNAADAIQCGLGHIACKTLVGMINSAPFEPGWPVELAEGWDIAIASSAAGLLGGIDIFGYEVDA